MQSGGDPGGGGRVNPSYRSFSSGPHLRVVAREDFQGDGRDELADEVQPLFVEADLFHVNIVRGHRLVATSDPLVLRRKRNHTMLRDQQRRWRRLWCVSALVCRPEAIGY